MPLHASHRDGNSTGVSMTTCGQPASALLSTSTSCKPSFSECFDCSDGVALAPSSILACKRRVASCKARSHARR